MSVRKKAAKKISKIARQTGEAVVRESKEMVKSAARQASLDSDDQGIEALQGGGMTAKKQDQIKKKQEEERRKLEFYRRRIRELSGEDIRKKKEEKEKRKQQIEQAKAEQEEKIVEEKKKGVASPSSRPRRGTALLGLRKKGKGSGEMGSFTKRSR